MKKLLKNGKIINVFIDAIVDGDILIDDTKIIGIGSYDDSEADEVIDISGKYVCPSFVDGHIHIESTMMTPPNFARAVIPHGTLTVMADPHEIVNVAGKDGMKYMLQSVKGLPMDIYYMLPSCVKVTEYDETGGLFELEDMKEFYDYENVLGLGEVMNYPDVINDEKKVIEKVEYARSLDVVINGHAPLLSGKGLDKYIAEGIEDDHECTSFAEAKEKLEKGQWIMVRQGTAARNLEALLGCFDEPYNRRCLLVTDDKEATDILQNGHIDSIIRLAIKAGKSPLVAIRMASLQAAKHYKLKDYGAVAPGYLANFLVLNDLDSIDINDVYYRGNCVVKDKKLIDFENPVIDEKLNDLVHDTMRLKELKASDFNINIENNKARVINLTSGEIITKLTYEDIKEENNGIDINNDLLKIAVCERYGNSGNIGLGYIKGLGLKTGAIAISVSHDSHNLVIAGTNEEDMAKAANTVRDNNGGLCIACGEEIIDMALPVGGLMSDLRIEELVNEINKVSVQGEKLGIEDPVAQIMRLAFAALTCIPEIRLCTFGLFDVTKMKLVPLFGE